MIDDIFIFIICIMMVDYTYIELCKKHEDTVELHIYIRETFVFFSILDIKNQLTSTDKIAENID